MNRELQNYIRLNENAEKIRNSRERVAVILEGRDGAGKSGTIRAVTKYLPLYAHMVEHSFRPSKWAMKNWLPLLPGPELAIDNIPALSCFRSTSNSSLNS